MGEEKEGLLYLKEKHAASTGLGGPGIWLFPRSAALEPQAYGVMPGILGGAGDSNSSPQACITYAITLWAIFQLHILIYFLAGTENHEKWHTFIAYLWYFSRDLGFKSLTKTKVRQWYFASVSSSLKQAYCTTPGLSQSMFSTLTENNKDSGEQNALWFYGYVLNS